MHFMCGGGLFLNFIIALKPFSAIIATLDCKYAEKWISRFWHGKVAVSEDTYSGNC